MTVNYKGVKILDINALKKIQVVIDALNKYKNISDEELEKLYQKALKEEKSDLEIEIKKLREEKKKLSQYNKNIKEVESKLDELKELLTKINE